MGPDLGWVILELLGRDRKLRPVRGYNTSGAIEGLYRCALDVHLDDVYALQFEIGCQLVDPDKRNIGGRLVVWSSNDEAVRAGIVRVFIQGQRILLVPDSHRRHDDATVGYLLPEIAPQTF